MPGVAPGIREAGPATGQISHLSIRPGPQLPEVPVAIGLVVKPSSSTAGPQEDGCAPAKGDDR